MVVIVILAVVAALVLPRLPAPEGTRLKDSARNLATGIRYLNDQAIVRKQSYRLRLNPGEGSISIVQVSPGGEIVASDDPFMKRELIQEGIIIEDVIVPRLGKVTEGEVDIPFGPGGNPEFIQVHLKGGEARYTVTAYPGGGKVKVEQGYQEEIAS